MHEEGDHATKNQLSGSRLQGDGLEKRLEQWECILHDQHGRLLLQRLANGPLRHHYFAQIRPGEVLFVEGAIGFPDGEDEMEQLAHAVADGDVAAFAFGPETAIEGADGRVVLDGGAGGVPEVEADQVVALGDMLSVPGGKGLPLLVDAGAVFLGKDAEVADQMVGRREAIDVDDLGDQDCGGGLADAGDGEDLDVRRGG